MQDLEHVTATNHKHEKMPRYGILLEDRLRQGDQSSKALPHVGDLLCEKHLRVRRKEKHLMPPQTARH